MTSDKLEPAITWKDDTSTDEDSAQISTCGRFIATRDPLHQHWRLFDVDDPGQSRAESLSLTGLALHAEDLLKLRSK